jgi:pilus assembly protein CpaB
MNAEPDQPRAGPAHTRPTARPGPVDRLTEAVRRAGWRRAVLARRIVAAGLLVLAGVLALRPGTGSATAEVLVAAHDLAPGAVVADTDLVLRTWPAELVPAGALTEGAGGRVLAGAMRAGEPLTDLRLAGGELAVSATGIPDAAAVPVRLADPEVAALLVPGTRVDVVAAAAEGGAPRVIADSAVVLTVLEPGSGGSAARGRSALVALPRELATRVAAASLSDEVAVTLRSPH